MPELVLTYADVAALRADVEANLRRGRAFVGEASGVEERTPCTLVVVHPQSGATLRFVAEAVYVRSEAPGRGVGVTLDGVNLDVLRTFAAGEPAPALDPTHIRPADHPAEELEIVGPADDPAEGLELVGPADDPAEELELVADEATEEPAPNAPHGDDSAAARNRPAGGAARDDAARTVYERIRKLSLTEQQRVARSGTMGDRIALERAFGPAVWEALLANTRLSVPEVARIAKKGTLPKPLIEVIAANGAWLATPDVQRALLSNPRTGGAVLMKVLRALSRVDLSRVPQQTAYPMAARQAAKKMIADG